MQAPGGTGPDAADAPRPSEGLDEHRRLLLAFEGRPWRDAARKSDAIREELGLSPARYYRQLADLLDDPAALRHDPMLVKRLQRQRDARAAARGERTLPVGVAERGAPTRPRQDP